MRAHDESDRWPTVNLKPDQLEQVLATDVVETIRIDEAMAVVLARLEAQKQALPAARPVHYGAPLALASLAILFGSLALLLDSGLWRADWRAEGIIAFVVVAVVAAGGAVALLIRRLGERGGAAGRR